MPEPCLDEQIPKWSFEIGQLGCPLVQVAGWLGDLDAVAHLLHLRSCDVSALNTALHAAAKCGRCSITQYVVAKRADVNAFGPEGHAPLHLAAEGGHVAVLEFLLDARAEADVPDASPRGGSALP